MSADGTPRRTFLGSVLSTAAAAWVGATGVFSALVSACETPTKYGGPPPSQADDYSGPSRGSEPSNLVGEPPTSDASVEPPSPGSEPADGSTEALPTSELVAKYGGPPPVATTSPARKYGGPPPEAQPQKYGGSPGDDFPGLVTKYGGPPTRPPMTTKYGGPPPAPTQ